MKNKYAYLVGLLVLLLFAYSYNGGGLFSTKAVAVDKVQGLYEILTNTRGEVLTVTDESGLYHVVIRNEQTLNDFYVTKDGKFMTDRLVNVEEQSSQLNAEKTWVTCLQAAGVRVLGRSNDAATVTQLQLLGPFGGSLYVDCAQNAQVCQQLGLQNVPVILHDKQLYAGPQSREWFAQLANCPLGA